MRVGKAATTMRKMHSKHSYVFGEENERLVTLSELYSMGVMIAYKMLQYGIEKREVAIVGRLTKFSCASFLACTLVGRTSCCIDSKSVQKMNGFDIIPFGCVVLDYSYLRFDLDLSAHEQVKIVFVFGESDRYKIIPHSKLKIIHLMAEELNGPVNPFMQKVVHDYEPIANKLQVLTYNYSSGSTGEPKIMMYPNKVALDRLQFTDNFGYINALGYRETWRLLKQLRSLRIGVSSNFNSYALIHFILHLTNVPNPTRIVIIDQQKPETWCRLFETHQTLAIFFFVPVLTRLILTDSFKTCDLRFLKRIRTGGASLTPAMHDRVFKMFRKYHNYYHDIYPIITSGYGATEFGSLVFECGHFSPAIKKINTVGKKVINESVQAKIVNSNNEEVKNGESGEILIKSSLQMINYYRNRLEGRLDWIRSGDIGFIDQDGYLNFVGRKSDLITLMDATKTTKNDILKVFQKNPEIKEVAVMSKPTENAYDEVYVHINTDASEEEINDFVTSNFSPNLNLKIKTLNSYLPKLQNGKYDLMKMLKQSSTQ